MLLRLRLCLCLLGHAGGLQVACALLGGWPGGGAGWDAGGRGGCGGGGHSPGARHMLASQHTLCRRGGEEGKAAHAFRAGETG